MSFAIAAAAAACTSSDDPDEGSSGRRRSLAEALTNGIEFDNGVLRTRPLPDADEGGERVRLDPGNSPLRLAPGQDSLMSFGVENPDEEGEPVDSFLMQFAGSESHIEVSRSEDNVSERGGAGSLTVEIGLKVADDICEQLCNRRYTSQIIIAVTLDDGAVSVHVRRALELDCREDGDPDFCGDQDVEEPRLPPVDSGMSRDDAAAPMEDAAAPGPDASAEDAGTVDAGEPGPPPQIGPLVPANVPAAMAVTLAVAGAGFVRGAVVHVDGEPMPTTYLSASSLEAEVSAAATSEAGSHAVYVDNVPGDDRTRSNVLYLQVDPPPNAPLVYDYSPDNGVPGDTILIIARSLAGQTLMIHDVNGTELTPGALSTIIWPTAGTVDTVEVVLPDAIATGPITVSNPLGAYKGKIFSVGQNLTRAAGTLVESSSEYNTTVWSRASGADNLLATSFFTANYDCASDPACTTIPWYQITFASAQSVGRIAMRGNREYASGYDFLRGKFEVLDAAGDVLWEGDYDLPAPDRDLDLTFSRAITGARSVRFTSIMDESYEPGFAELEVFGP
jgi:hypothetical protein